MRSKFFRSWCTDGFVERLGGDRFFEDEDENEDEDEQFGFKTPTHPS